MTRPPQKARDFAHICDSVSKLGKVVTKAFLRDLFKKSFHVWNLVKFKQDNQSVTLFVLILWCKTVLSRVPRIV